jgi:uncharacterized membrane protein YheB (UPF0754 family)
VDYHVTNIIHYLARSHVEMAKIMEEKRHIAVHMSQLIDQIPDHPAFKTVEQTCKNSMDITENLTAYLNSIAELEEAIAENLTHVIKEMSTGNAADE